MKQYTAMQEALWLAIRSGRHQLVGAHNTGTCEEWVVTDAEDGRLKGEIIAPILMLSEGYPKDWIWTYNKDSALYVRFAAEDLKAIDTFIKTMPSHTCLCELQLAMFEERAKLVFTSKAHFEADEIFRVIKIGRYAEGGNE